MKKLTDMYFKALEFVMVICLAAMCVMVFGNVVLRHFFNSGVNIAEELSRFMFIWLTFLGAIVAMREGGHLGVDVLVRRLRGGPRFIMILVSQTLILGCCAVLLWGLLKQHGVNSANVGLITGIPMSIVYSAAYLCAVSIGLVSLWNIILLVTGRRSPAELIPSNYID